MIEPALTPKQAAFVVEYLIDLNATQAAIRAGYSAKTAGKIAARMACVPTSAVAKPSRELTRQEVLFVARWYVYELVDPRDNSAFYVGKGKGLRAWNHERDVRAGRFGNAAKQARIAEILSAGKSIGVRIVAEFDDEAEAFAKEKSMIHSGSGLTNISHGSEMPERAAARVLREATHLHARTIPYDVWVNLKPRSLSDIELYHYVNTRLGGLVARLRAS